MRNCDMNEEYLKTTLFLLFMISTYLVPAQFFLHSQYYDFLGDD